jgi:hypothetical protein
VINDIEGGEQMKQIQFKDVLPGDFFYLSESDRVAYDKRRNEFARNISTDRLVKFNDSDLVFIDWDWNRLVPSSVFYKESLDGYPVWDRYASGSCHFVMLEIVHQQDKPSRDIAIEFDDIAEGHFYYRDWTGSSLPFVDSSELYASGYWFELASDAYKFVELYGGSGIWMDDHESYVRDLNVRMGRA